jgi:hypothetical protein
MEFECGALFLTETAQTRQHFFVDDLPGFSKRMKLWQAFFSFFADCGSSWAVRLVEWKSISSRIEGSSLRFAMVTVVLLFCLCRHGCCVGLIAFTRKTGALLLLFANGFEGAKL